MTTPKLNPTQRGLAAAPAKPMAKARGLASKRTPTTPPAATEREAAAPSPNTETLDEATHLDRQPTLAKGPSGKLGIVVALMRRPEGATVAQMGAATGWQPHSVRGALAGSLKRKHKLAIIGEAGESGRVYRIGAEPAA